MRTRLEEAVLRLSAQSAALIAVLQQTPAADGQPILNQARWNQYQKNLQHELMAVGLDLTDSDSKSP